MLIFLFIARVSDDNGVIRFAQAIHLNLCLQSHDRVIREPVKVEGKSVFPYLHPLGVRSNAWDWLGDFDSCSLQLLLFFLCVGETIRRRDGFGKVLLVPVVDFALLFGSPRIGASESAAHWTRLRVAAALEWMLGGEGKVVCRALLLGFFCCWVAAGEGMV